MDERVIDAISVGKLSDVKDYFKEEDINKTDSLGWNALMVAASSQQWEVCEWLLNSNINAKHQSVVDQQTILHVLADQRSNITSDTTPPFIKIWSLAIQKGADPLTPNKSGEICLHLASLRGNTWAVRFLLESKHFSTINIPNKCDITPIQYASAYGHNHITKILSKWSIEHENKELISEFAQLLKQMTKNSKTKFLVPFDIQIVIFSYLDPADLCSVSRVCKMFYKTSCLDILWKKMGSPSWEKQKEYSATKNWKEKYLIWIRYQVTLWKAQEVEKIKRQQQQDQSKKLKSKTILKITNVEPTLKTTPIESLKITEQSVIHFYTPPQSDYVLLKLLMVGDSGVGKTSYMSRLADNTFTMVDNYDFKITHIQIDGQPVKLQTWDIGRLKNFQSIFVSNKSYSGATGFFVFYNICDLYSFENVKWWLNEIENHAKLPKNVIIVGTKCDDTSNRQVSTEQGLLLATQYGLPFIETSAKNDVNIKAAAEVLTMIIIKNREFEFFKQRTHYGWPLVIPHFEIMKKVLKIEKESLAFQGNFAIKPKCAMQ